MKKAIPLVLGALALATANIVQAKEIHLEGRVLARSCQSPASARDGEFKVTYANALLPPGATVAVRYGLGGSVMRALESGERQRFWSYFDQRQVVPMEKIGDNAWSASFQTALESLARPDDHYRDLNFAFIVRLTDGRHFIDHGSSYWAVNFYQAVLATDGCLGSGGGLPAAHSLEVTRRGHGSTWH